VAGQTSFILGIAMIVMLWAGIALKFKDQAARNYQSAVQNNRNLALLFEENVRRAVGEVDKAILSLRRQVETADETADFQRILSTKDVFGETIVQYSLIDAQGTLRAASKGPRPTPPIDLKDREHYITHRNNADRDDLYVSRPVVGRLSKMWSIQLTRRVLAKDGSFGGAIVGSLNPDHFTQFYASIDLGPTGSITLIGLDGIVRAAGGSSGQGRHHLGQDLAASPLLREVYAQEAGTFIDHSGDNAHIVTYRRIRGLPLAVAVSVARAQVYATAYNDAIRHGFIGVLLSLIILAVAMKGSRDQLRLRLAKAKLLHSQRRTVQASEQLRLTLDNMTQGIILVTKDHRIPVINSRAAELLDLPEKFLQSKPTFPELVTYQENRGEYATVPIPEGVRALDYFTQKDASGAMRSYERTRPNGVVLEVRSTALPDGGFVRTFTDITPKRQAQEAVMRLTSEDGLTGLANRRHFRDEVQKSVNRLISGDTESDDAQGFALLTLDVDWFKAVNDTLGHWIGDGLLQAIAERLRSVARPGNLVARLGGDEFGMLLPDTCSTEQPEALAGHISEALSQPYDIFGHHIQVGVSIGIALAPHDGTDPELLLRASDMALYAAKAAGRGTCRFFHKSMAEQLRMRRQLEIDLRSALDNDQLALHYQPVIRTADKVITGFEALMRWDHPMRGMVPPGEFIPIAEETGLIVSLGAWALRKACEQATRWPNDLSVAVNVSPMQFRSGNVVGTVIEALRDTGLNASRLHLEITETILMQDSDATVQVLNQLRSLGVRISMDDFGTGYSSLSYLRSFPLDRIKIDRAFVKDLGSSSASDVIVRSVIDIARTLKMTTTAEGVETREQFEKLAALGCHEAQGYHLSKPVPVSQIADLIAKWSARMAA
jgi:diguanylate cyclase (GGDEF)-like protein